MLETLRSEMLETMGVKILHPRFQLAAAKPSCLLPEFPEVDIEHQPSAELLDKEQLDGKPLDKDGDLTADMRSDLQGQIETEQQSSPATHAQRINVELDDLQDIKTAIQTPSDVNKKIIKYRHRIICVGELVMIVDQPSLEWQFSEQTKQFFSDIYFALTQKRPEYWAESQFDWPPTKNFPLAADAVVARQTLVSFIQEKMQNSQAPQLPDQTRWIVVWGDAVARHIFGDLSENADEQGDIQFVNETSTLLVNSLDSYWQEPSNKKLLWQQLQTVKKSLHANA